MTTITEEIIASHTEKSGLSADDVVVVSVDKVMTHENAWLVDRFLKIMKKKPSFPKNRVMVTIDHRVPANTEKIAELHIKVREFARKYGFIFYNMTEGICHQVVADKQFVYPGEIFAGSDSHTLTAGAFNSLAIGFGASEIASILSDRKIWLKIPECMRITLQGKLNSYTTPKDVALKILSIIGSSGAIYKNIEFSGRGIENISISGRMTICNMMAETGAKSAIFPFDNTLKEFFREKKITSKYIESIGCSEACRNHSDYINNIFIELDELVPLIAKPSSPDNVVAVESVAGRSVDQIFIGSCTNGRLEDIKITAEILKNNNIHPDVRLIVIPASKTIFEKAIKFGYIKDIIKAGGVVGYPNCGPCLGAHMGVISPGETVLSTSNRNFPGRMGAKNSKIYLSSPATASASAIKGVITSPEDL